MDFWIACQDFRNIKESEELQRRAKRIYEDFVRKDAPKQVRCKMESIVGSQIRSKLFIKKRVDGEQDKNKAQTLSRMSTTSL